MATYTPPPYFPQEALAGADEKRYRKFKLAVIGIACLLLLLIVGVGIGAWYLLKTLI
jgi:hypothetical protein